MANPLIVRDFSRCILCGRCVQACNEVQVNRDISHGYRGTRSKLEIFGEEMIEKRVTSSGNSGRVYLPPDWVGRHVKIIRID